MYVYIFSPPSQKLFDIIHSFIIHTDKNKVSILSPSIDLKPMPVLVSILSILVQYSTLTPYCTLTPFMQRPKRSECDISRRLLPLLCNTGILNLVLCHSGYLNLKKKCLCSCVHQSEERQETKQEKRKKIIAMHGLGKGCNFFC